MAFKYDYAQGDDLDRMGTNALLWNYGTTDVNAIRQKRAQDLANTQLDMNRQQLAQQTQAKAQQASDATDELGRRNRLGLSPLVNQLVDPESAAYQTTYGGKTPDELGWKAQVSVGGLDGSAPADLAPPPPEAQTFGLRTLRPGMQAKFDSMSTDNSRTLTPEEYQGRLDAQTKARLALEDKQAQDRQGLAHENNTTKRVIAAGSIQARDPANAANSGPIAQGVLTSGTQTLKQPPVASDPIQVDVDPAMSGLPAPAQSLVKQYMQQYPGKSAGEIINQMRKKGLI